MRGYERYFALNSNVAAVAATIAIMSFGENLWKRFLPKYLEQLGAPIAAIGLFGTTEDLLDGLYQYPGGWLGDHLGRRNALFVFILSAAAGYLVYWSAPTWQWIFAGQALAMAWASMASPTLFSVVGDALPSSKRAMGFTVQAIVKRIPVMVGPTLGGLVIAAYGISRGTRGLLLCSAGFAGVALIACSVVRLERIPGSGRVTIAGVWRLLPTELRRLLLSDIFIRTCEGMVDIFLVLYATNVIGVTAPQFGGLVAIQALASVAVYIPAARLASRFGRKPFVTATFLFFALFPVAVVLSRTFMTLAVAFVIGGLREVGEPSRKAMIVDLAEPHVRARTVGLYYLIRSVAISPAAFVGGILWNWSPQVPFVVAGAIGLMGVAVFVYSVDERFAG